MIKEVHFHKRNLPHIYISGSTYFITYRLKGSIPTDKINVIKSNIQKNNKIRNREDYYESQIKFFAEYDKILNSSCYGPKFLDKNNIAEIIKNSLFYFDKKKCSLICFCIMPNHVHVVLTLDEENGELDKLMKLIKGYSANGINKILNKTGSLWQSESYDHVVRNEDEFLRILKYVIYNPVKAGLVKNWEDWPHTYLNEEYI